jgi:hypothetical protein
MILHLDSDGPAPVAQTQPSGLILVDELLRLKRVAANKRHAREAVARYRGEIPAPESSDAPQADVAPGRAVLTDCAGSPSESQCPKSQLDNILSVRDEIEARKARETVRRRDGGGTA